MTLTQMPHFKHAPSDNIRSSSCPCWWSSPGEAPLVTPVLYSGVRSCVLSFRSTAAGFSGLQLTLVGGNIPALYLYDFGEMGIWGKANNAVQQFWLRLRPVSGQALSATRGKDALRSNQTFGLKIPNMQFIPRFYRRHFSTSKASPFCFAC